MKTIDRRLVKLELRMLPPPENLSEERAICEMLIAGEWQMAMQVLEQQDTQLVKAWQSKGRRAWWIWRTASSSLSRIRMLF